MRVIWSGPAASDLSALRAYIARDNERAANEMIVRILSRAEQQLPTLPKSGRPGRIPNTRELVLTGTPFILPHRIVGDTIHIFRVFHSPPLAKKAVTRGSSSSNARSSRGQRPVSCDFADEWPHSTRARAIMSDLSLASIIEP